MHVNNKFCSSTDNQMLSKDETCRKVQHLLVPEEVILTAFDVKVN